MMSKARLLLTAGFVAGIFTAGESHAGWRKAKAHHGRMVSVRSDASWSDAYGRAGEARHGGGDGHTAYGAAWEDFGWSHLVGYPYYGCPFFAVGVAGDSLGAVTPGPLGTSR
jgi:hypothetical protein